MTPRRRRHLGVTLAVMLLGAATELMTIGAVLPFLALISDPGRAASVPAIRSLFDALGSVVPGDMLTLAALLLIGAAIIAALVRLLLTWVSLRFVLAFSHDIGSAIFERMLRQPYSYYVTRNTSEVLAGIDKVQAVIWSVLMPAMQGIIAAVIALSIGVLLFLIDPFSATVAAGVMTFSYLGVSLAVRGRLHRNSIRLADATVERIQTIQEGLGGIRDILLEQSQEVFERKFRRVDHAYRRAQVVNNFIGLGPRFVVEAAGIVLIALLALLMSRQPGGVLAAIPVLGALALGAQRLLPLLQQSYIGWSSFAGNRQMLLDVVGLLRAPVVTSERRDKARPVAPFRDSLTLENVGFNYQARGHALHGISLTIAKGSRIGFVGETGSGKSTLLDLVMGLLEPTTGTIRIDGAPLDDRNRANWQAQIAHVPQSIYLSDSSMASNIAFGEAAGELDLDRIRRAAAMAHIDTFIESLPQGYDTPVGERGVRLSGGQRQRIGIARALYKQASVLIFDEATSALDADTETAVMESIVALGAEVTLLMIAHRTSTLAGCDRIVRLANGAIAEVGNQDDMLCGVPTPQRL